MELCKGINESLVHGFFSLKCILQKSKSYVVHTVTVFIVQLQLRLSVVPFALFYDVSG
jgi:hypothetical protein